MANSPDLTISEHALELLAEALASDDPKDFAIRVRAQRVGVRRFNYAMDVVEEGDQKAEDLTLSLADGKVQVWVDPESASNLVGAKVDFVDLGGLKGSGFKFENPMEAPNFSEPLERSLQKLLEEEINPSLAGHGGFVELIKVEKGEAYVSMGGGCQGCGQASATMRDGVESRVLEQIPEITRLIDVTDHGAGETPYYS